jgi:hypothetical protein
MKPKEISVVFTTPFNKTSIGTLTIIDGTNLITQERAEALLAQQMQIVIETILVSGARMFSNKNEKNI